MTLSVAVTGAGGFIGSAIVETLRKRDTMVYALLGPPNATLVPAPPGVSHTTCDITDVDRLRDAFAGVDVVVHAAGPPSVVASLADPIEFVRVHVLGTACVIEAMRAAGVSSIVYISSAEVYGSPMNGVVHEDHELKPRSPYGAAKLGAEALLRAAGVAFGLRGYLLRPFSVYGPRMTANSLLGTIAAQARRGNVLELEDLAPVRDYCYVQDVAEAVAAACACIPSDIRALNVATGIPTSVRELVAAVGTALNRTFDIRKRDDEQRPHAIGVPRMIGSNVAIRSALDWAPVYDLRAGLDETMIAMGVA
jgi:nucleoside-diphosphate-sugar epimerase